MWAQLQKVNTKPKREAELLEVFEQLHAIEQPDSGAAMGDILDGPPEFFDLNVLRDE